MLQEEEYEAYRDLQEEQRHKSKESQHAGADPVEGVWKAEGTCHPDCFLKPLYRACAAVVWVK